MTRVRQRGTSRRRSRALAWLLIAALAGLVIALGPSSAALPGGGVGQPPIIVGHTNNLDAAEGFDPSIQDYYNIKLRDDPGTGNTVSVWVVPDVELGVSFSQTGPWTYSPAHLDIVFTDKDGATPYNQDVKIWFIAYDDADVETTPHTGTIHNTCTLYESDHPEISVDITDNDTEGPGVIGFDPTSYTVSEVAGTVTVTVVRTGADDGAVSANYADVAGGTATVVDDYADVTGTVSWADHESGAKTFTASIVNDSLYELDETIFLELSGVTGGASLGTHDATVTITGPNDALPGTIAFDPASYSVSESAGTVVVTVTRTGGDDGAVSVNYAGVAGGTASMPDDYADVSGTLTWADQDSASQTFTVSIVNDSLYELDETAFLELSGVTGGASLGTHDATVTITGPNDVVAGTIGFDPTSYTVNESAGTVTVTVTRTGGDDGAASVHYADLGTGTATSGSDYTAITAGTLSWDDGDSTDRIISISILQDVLHEATETINLGLSGAEGATIGAPNATVNITDDDTPGVLVNPTELSGTEGGSAGHYHVVLTSQPTADVTVTVSPDSQVTTGSASLTFTSSNWNTEQQVDVSIPDDLVIENPHPLGHVNHSAASYDPSYHQLGVASVTVTILDNDQPTPPPPHEALDCCIPPTLRGPWARFTDMTNNWARDNAVMAGTLGIIEAWPPGPLHPNAPLTRAEFMVMLIKAIGHWPTASQVPLTDVKRTDWFYPYLLKAIDAEIVVGYPGNTFRPDAIITRQEAAMMLARALVHHGAKPVVSQYQALIILAVFTDRNELSGWAINPTALAVDESVVIGRSKAQLAPNAPLTRAEAVTALIRIWRWYVSIH